MSIDRYHVGHATFFVVMIALGGALTAQSAPQTAQQPPTSIGDVSPPDQRSVDPVTGKTKPDAKPPAPTPGASLPAPTKSSGKVGPGGKVVGQGPSSPGGAKVLDKATERLGPSGKAGKASDPAGSGPGGAAAQAPSNQSRRAEVVTPSQAAKASQSGQPVAKGGAYVFIDPATGLITEPTEAQLREVEAQNATAGLSFGEVVEREGFVSGGMIADVPESFFPVVTASVGIDGKVTLTERNGQAASSAVISNNGPQGEQLLVNSDVQRNGPAGDVHLELPPAADVVVSIVNLDAAGEGFNDPTAVAPVFGNRGTTRGQQRLNAFRAAAEFWGGILRSTVPIQISASMDSLTPCDAGGGVLGSAGPNTVHRDFGGAPLAATWYVQAVANSRTGADQDPANTDIRARFNSDVDNNVCLGATSWWYGIGAPAPAGTIDFYTVVLHEIGHGIGVLTFVNLTTGAKFGGIDDAYERWLWDWTVGGWPAMTNAQRAASATNNGQVIFWGPRATEAARGLETAGLNGNYARVYAPAALSLGSSISHFDTVLTPNELMEPFITPPPGPYGYVTGGLLEDVGWRLLANGVFDYGGLGTWTWNPTDGWFQPTGADPTNLEPFNGNFVGIYNGTWLWNETTGGWSQITTANPTLMKACRDNLLWSGAAYGTWRWNPATGWQQLTTANPQSLDCFGGDMVWESPLGTWLYAFTGAGWSQITGADPVGVQPCGSRLVWWRAGDTWYWDAASGWHYLTIGPETTECYRGQLAWEGAAGPGTWLYNFTTGTWQQITGANPEQMLAWGPSLVWENAAFGTWTYDGGWEQITTANPTFIEVLGANLLWSWPGGTWVWSGGGGGDAWTNITGAVPQEIVSSGAVAH